MSVLYFGQFFCSLLLSHHAFLPSQTHVTPLEVSLTSLLAWNRCANGVNLPFRNNSSKYHSSALVTLQYNVLIWTGQKVPRSFDLEDRGKLHLHSDRQWTECNSHYDHNNHYDYSRPWSYNHNHRRRINHHYDRRKNNDNNTKNKTTRVTWEHNCNHHTWETSTEYHTLSSNPLQNKGHPYGGCVR